MSNMRITSIEALEQRIDALEKRYEETGIIIAKMFAVLAALRDGGTRAFGTLCSHLERDIMQPEQPTDDPANEAIQFAEDLKPKIPRRRWSYDDDRELARMLRAGKNRGEIADALGRTRDAVKRHIFELRKKWNA